MGVIAFNAGDIESTLTLDRSPFQRGLREARAEANAFEKKKIRAKLDVDVDKRSMDKLERDMARVSKQRKGIRVNVNVDKSDVDQVKSLLEDIGDNTEATARRSGSRMARALLNPLVIQLGLLPGIAMASAGAAGLAMGALVAGFAGIAIAAQKNNAQIKQAYSSLWSDIKTDTQQMTEPLVDTFVDVASDIRQTWEDLGPDLSEIFTTIEPYIKNVSNGILGMAEQAVPRFNTALKQSGPIMGGMENLLTKLGTGVGDLTVNMTENSVATGHSLGILGDFVSNLLGKIGSLISLFTRFWSDVGPQFNRVFEKMTSLLVGVTDGGLSAFANGLTVTLSILEMVLNVLGPVSDILGGTIGYLLSGAAAWKLLAGGVGLFGKAWNALSPAAMATRLSGTTTAIEKMSMATGGFVTKATGSEKAGERVSGVMTKIGKAAVGAAAALPILGTALAAGKAAADHFWPSADEVAQKILQGGHAAEEAQSQYLNAATKSSWWAKIFGASSQDVAEAQEKILDSMTDVEVAQTRQAQAQANYDLMVERHGKTSEQAAAAQDHLRYTTQSVAEAQRSAEQATKSTTQAMLEQINLQLGAVGAQLNYQNSLLQLEQAQKAVNEAVKAHGRGSLEARQADTAYQQNLLSVIQTVGDRAAKEAEARGEIDASRYANASMRAEIVRLAVAAGKNLPPALNTMIAGFTDSELAAYGVKREVNNTGQAIYRLPPGKKLRFPTDATQTKNKVQDLADQVNRVPGTHYIDFILRTIGSPPPAPATGFGPGLGMLGTVPRRAGGGPVEANKPYWVGDDPINRPELFFPNVDGFILNGLDSARLSQAGKSSKRTPSPAGQSGSAAAVPDLDQMAEAFYAAMLRALDKARFRVDGAEWAKLVTEQKLHDARR